MLSELFLKEFVSGIGDFWSALVTGFFTAFIAPLFTQLAVLFGLSSGM
ncbi:MAG: hypothetical protein ACE5EC_07340 [Phycisphaerae bacterium]